MSLRKNIHRAAASMNMVVVVKKGKPQLSPLQRMAQLVEDATWDAPDSLRGPRGKEVLNLIAETFPAIDPAEILRSRDHSLVDCLDRAAKNYWSIERDFKDIDGAMIRAIFGLKGPEAGRFLDGLKNPAAADPEISNHSVLSSLREVAQAPATLSLPTKEHWGFLRECPYAYGVSRFPTDAAFQAAFREQSAYLAGVAIAQTLWDDVCSSVPLPDEAWSQMTDAEMHERVEACEELLGRGNPLTARHTAAELVALGRDAHLHVDAVMEAAAETKPEGWGKSMSADALQSCLRGAGAIAPAAADWQGPQDFLGRVTASKVIDHLGFQIQMRVMKRHHAEQSEEMAL